MDLFAAGLVAITILTICGICLFILICAIQPTALRYFHRRRSRTISITASTKPHDRDTRTYLKTLERSVRTGRRIVEEEENPTRRESTSKPFNFLYRYAQKPLHSSTTNLRSSTEC